MEKDPAEAGGSGEPAALGPKRRLVWVSGTLPSRWGGGVVFVLLLLPQV